jgi:hypothetical protein
MSAQSQRDAEYITKVRQLNRQLWEAIVNLQECQRQWTALDYLNTLPPGDKGNEGIVAADVGAIVFDTTNAFVAVLEAGHATNMAKLL